MDHTKEAQRKHVEALERRAAYKARSPEEQLARLIERGAGECQEAHELRAVISRKEATACETDQTTDAGATAGDLP